MWPCNFAHTDPSISQPPPYTPQGYPSSLISKLTPLQNLSSIVIGSSFLDLSQPGPQNIQSPTYYLSPASTLAWSAMGDGPSVISLFIPADASLGLVPPGQGWVPPPSCPQILSRRLVYWLKKCLEFLWPPKAMMSVRRQWIIIF